MTIATTEIKHIENSFEVLNSIEVNLEDILSAEFVLGLPNDIENPV